MIEDRPNDMTIEERVLELENESKALLTGMANIDAYLREFETLIGERLRQMDEKLGGQLEAERKAAKHLIDGIDG